MTARPLLPRFNNKRVMGQLRQWLFPPEFRIDPSEFTGKAKAESPDSLAQPLALVIESPPREEGVGTVPESVLRPFIIELSTSLWRARTRLLADGSEEPLPEMRRVYRHVQKAWDLLETLQIRVIDHTNEPYQPGLYVKVISMEKRPGLSKPVVIETIRPSVCQRDQLLQAGEVIVAVPADD